jgi:hypothetical protein
VYVALSAVDFDQTAPELLQDSVSLPPAQQHCRHDGHGYCHQGCDYLHRYHFSFHLSGENPFPPRLWVEAFYK